LMIASHWDQRKKRRPMNRNKGGYCHSLSWDIRKESKRGTRPLNLMAEGGGGGGEMEKTLPAVLGKGFPFPCRPGRNRKGIIWSDYFYSLEEEGCALILNLPKRSKYQFFRGKQEKSEWGGGRHASAAHCEEEEKKRGEEKTRHVHELLTGKEKRFLVQFSRCERLKPLPQEEGEEARESVPKRRS